MYKCVVVFAVLLVVNLFANPLYSRPTPEVMNLIAPEEPCIVQGGACLRGGDCDPADTVQLADLCPKQSHLGIVCCYSQY